MSSEILLAAIEALNSAGIPAERAYPGKPYPKITAPQAVVHIYSAQPGQGKTVLEVTVLTPGEDGGVAGELQTMAAARALVAIGGSCSQSGCSYDGMRRAYATKILAEFTESAYVSVFIGDAQLEYAVEFTSEENVDAQAYYTIGENTIRDVNRGPVSWQLTVTEKIPLGVGEIHLPQGESQVRVVREGGGETFSGCIWTRVHRSYTPEGMMRTMTAIAKVREGA